MNRKMRANANNKAARERRERAPRPSRVIAEGVVEKECGDCGGTVEIPVTVVAVDRSIIEGMVDKEKLN